MQAGQGIAWSSCQSFEAAWPCRCLFRCACALNNSRPPPTHNTTTTLHTQDKGAPPAPLAEADLGRMLVCHFTSLIRAAPALPAQEAARAEAHIISLHNALVPACARCVAACCTLSGHHVCARVCVRVRGGCPRYCHAVAAVWGGHVRSQEQLLPTACACKGSAVARAPLQTPLSPPLLLRQVCERRVLCGGAAAADHTRGSAATGARQGHRAVVGGV